MPVNEKLSHLIYNYFYTEYEDEDVATAQSENLSKEILSLMKDIDYNIERDSLRMVSKAAHTLKHLLLYADLDDVIDLCQELEDKARNGELDLELKEEIFSKIVK